MRSRNLFGAKPTFERKEGRKECLPIVKEGRKEGRKAGRQEGRKEARKEGRQEGRSVFLVKEERKEGRSVFLVKEGREEEGRKEGRKNRLRRPSRSCNVQR
jgi:hypothetical protein